MKMKPELNMHLIVTNLERLAAFRQYATKPAAVSVSSVGAESFTKLNLTSDQASDITPYTRLNKH
jgi:hypothetical protein